jgi:O-antigen/teichoic acid export membrane protein
MELPTVKVRFLSSFFSNIFRSAISLITGLLIARWLGPSDYGRMSFLIVSFTAFRTLMDMGSSSAFFTFLSQRKRSKKFVSLFWRWIGLQFILTLVLVGLLFPSNLINEIWKGESRSLVILALIASFFQLTVWPIASQMAEANRNTIAIQRLNSIVVIVHLFVLVALWCFGKLILPAIFISLLIEWAIASWIASKMYISTKDDDTNSGDVEDTPYLVFKEFFKYCLPFIPYAWFSFAHDFADRWMLQQWGGSKEQGFYTISYQFASISLLATTSVLRIFWKEIAEAHFNNDKERVKQLYLRISRGLYFVAAIAAGAFIPWTAEIISLMLGDQYKGAYITMLLMFIYPVHQSIGQIGSTMLLATSKTFVQVKLGIGFMVVSIILVYFMLAPSNSLIPGLGLASSGLAWKMVIMQFLQVNILIWLLSKMFNWEYDWKFQIYGLLPTIVIGLLIKILLKVFIGITLIFSMAIYGVLYLAVIFILVYSFPKIAGLSRNDLLTLIPRLSKTKNN